MASAESFLKMVRSALGVAAGHEVEIEPATAIFKNAETVRAEADALRSQIAEGAAGLLDSLAEVAPSAGWQVRRCASPEDAAEAVLELCRHHGARTVVRTDHPVFARVPVQATLAGAGIDVRLARRDEGDDAKARAELRDASFEADVGITGVDYAVAETGTVVVNPGPGVPRMVSLAPPVHIAVVALGDVVPSLDELFVLARDSYLTGAHRGTMNLITGPSRTADIEGKIVTGMHGPLYAHLVILG